MTKISQMPFHYIYLKSLYFILFHFILDVRISLKIYGSWNDGEENCIHDVENAIKKSISRFHTSFSYLVKLYRKGRMVLEFDCFLNLVYRKSIEFCFSFLTFPINDIVIWLTIYEDKIYDWICSFCGNVFGSP